ncbi:MAG: hypothetical protein CSA11_10060 [Chloroflexi bacterium]|nr:MAG: hypothetical protein CSA11_10060 [Chloroflexota bacterium]
MMYPIVLTKPIQFDALVIGGGPVGERKVRGLLQVASAVTLISPTATPQLQTWAENGEIRWEKRPFQPTDLDNTNLIFAATNQRAINAQIAQLAHAKGLLCNVADAPNEGSFHLPAVHRGSDTLITVSTYGANPSRARHLRDKIAAWLEEIN